jgi:hypothetical protein
MGKDIDVVSVARWVEPLYSTGGVLYIENDTS